MLILYKDFSVYKINGKRIHGERFQNILNGVKKLRYVFNKEGQSKAIQSKINKKIAMQYDEDGIIKKPQCVSIETFNRCNNDCSFCPANKNHDVRKPQYMSRDTFAYILKMLKDWDYTGEICLSGNNEPLLDKRILEFAQMASSELGECKITLWTNAMLLNLDLFEQLMEYLDELQIDNYNDNYDLNPSVATIMQHVEKNMERYHDKRIVINLRKKNEILSSRGGKAPNHTNGNSIYSAVGCFSPYNDLFIRPNGELNLCCADVYGEFTIGSIFDKTLQDWWYGDEYLKLRELLACNRSKIDVCKQCDYYR